MNEIILKLVFRQQITEEEIHEALCDICDSVHASCDSECPVFELKKELNYDLRTCSYFRDGKAMAKFIRTHSKAKRE